MKKKIVIISIICFVILMCVIFVMCAIMRDYDRTDEEYIDVLLANQEDFEYVAQVMQQWKDGSLRFRSGGWNNIQEYVIENKFYVYKNQEIADEIENNQEFYEHLARIRDLDEILSIYIYDGKLIRFVFKKTPRNYSISLYYVDNTENLSSDQYSGYLGPFPVTIIDEHWILDVFPNT